MNQNDQTKNLPCWMDYNCEAACLEKQYTVLACRLQHIETDIVYSTSAVHLYKPQGYKLHIQAKAAEKSIQRTHKKSITSYETGAKTSY